MDIDPIFIRNGLIIFITLVTCIVFHEWGHAIAADLLGDDTPRADGRVTLNPLSHLDMFGSVIVPLINIFIFGAGLPFIAWGRPVVTNPSNLRNRWRDDILISLAGPAANLLLALVAILVGSFVALAQPRFGELVRELVVMNVGLAVFNLLPFPPLDGASILRRVMGISDATYLGHLAAGAGSSSCFAINIGADPAPSSGVLVAEAAPPTRRSARSSIPPRSR